jgi:UDP-3-O-[3-hydroxymyristoyl] glucosamine N-acyltransferase
MEFKAQIIAAFLNGEIEGDADATVTTVAKIEEATPGTLAFLANPKYNHYLYTTKATIVLVNKDLQLEQPVSCTLIRVADAYAAFASLLELYQNAKKQKVGVSTQACIEPSAKIGEDAYVGPFAYIGENVTIGNNAKIYPHVYIGDNTVIGDNATIYSGVKIYHECVLGNSVTIHASSVIGADGFGFAPSAANQYKKIPQIGNVVLEDYVEIGANACIDRATMGSTIIRKGVKLDNLIQVAHNVEVGENTVMAAQSGVAGSTKIGENCMFGGQVGIAGHITIANGVKLAAQTGIGNSLKFEDQILMGAPGIDIRNFQKSTIVFKNLPDLAKQVSELKKEIAALKANK